jgi:uncharacterized protein involved in exopolysaccharide biosynthesis
MDKATEIDSLDRLTIAGLLLRIRHWPKIFVVTALLTMAAVITYAFTTTPVYRGVVKLMPRENDNPGGALQSVLGQFGGLASMAGLSFGSVNEQEALALLKSRVLFTMFANEKDLMPILFQGSWDASARRWRAGLKHVPTMDDAWLRFDGGIRRVSDDPKTQLITLEVTWKDRQQAAEWANELARLANEALRERALRESAASIASYQEQLAHTDTVELRQSISKLMEVQFNRSAVAKSRMDYALSVIDPAYVPDPKHFVAPRRFLLLVISGPLGVFLAVCMVLIVEFAANTRAEMRRAR